MAKDSFVCYTEWSEKIALLTDEQAGILLKAIFAYMSDEQLPEMDGITEMCFLFMKSKFDWDARRYDELVRIRSEAGKKGADARWNGKNGKGISDDGKNGKGISANGKNAYHDYDHDYDHDCFPNNSLLANAHTRTRENDLRFGKTVKLRRGQSDG